ncbi:MAG: D-alanine--D-alanine ligase [Gammaproteobacteria bacterium]|nr:D-alanine--D-alanine ligase [Gammaproteobacteria bacterium]
MGPVPAAADFGRVAVLYGGRAAEREISLISGKAVLEALSRAGVDAHGFDPAERPIAELARFDRACILLHGRFGEDGTIQGVLDLMGIPYTGSGVLASALAMDKWRSKLVWRGAGLPTPPWMCIGPQSRAEEIEATLGIPVYIKPANEGSSIGVTRVSSAADLHAAYRSAAAFDEVVLAERSVNGGEYTVPILAGRALPVIRIVPANGFYDYEAKYLRDDTRYLCPCGLGATEETAVQALALEAFAVLGGRGWGRVDILCDEAGAPWLLEANTVPGMTGHSLVPMGARAAGIDFDELVVRILATSFEHRTARGGR